MSTGEATGWLALAATTLRRGIDFLGWVILQTRIRQSHDQKESQRWIRGFHTNDESAVADFWTRFEQRLRRLAERNLLERMKRRIDADDILQSAFRTFLEPTDRSAQSGRAGDALRRDIGRSSLHNGPTEDGPKTPADRRRTVR